MLREVLLLSVGIVWPVRAQSPVSVKVEIVVSPTQNQRKPARSVSDDSNVVVWLEPLDRPTQPAVAVASPPLPPQIIQHNKNFQPHILVVKSGTAVQFPNNDPFFHNIFSLFDGERFDLGLYESGSSRTVRFDRPGVSFLFCNIHPEMNAVVVAVDTPYFGLSGRTGLVTMQSVPDGHYEMHVWYERGVPENLKGLDQRVVISASSRSFGPIHVLDNADFSTEHKNKYGQEYVPAPRTSYVRP